MEMVTEAMNEDFNEAFKRFRNNKDEVKELNADNTEICKRLDEHYELRKGTARAYFMKRIKIEEGKDYTEDIHELQTKLEG